MDWNWLQNTLGEYLNKLTLWAKDDKRRLALFLVTVVFFGVVLIPKLSIYISNLDYIGLIASFLSFIYANSNTKEFATVIIIVVLFHFLAILRFVSHNSKRIFEINIEKQPELWSFYKGSGWSIIEDNTSWNKVLKLTNCTYPAILKFGNEWLNYNFSFEAKVPSSVQIGRQNFTFAIRAKDKGNSVFFQCKPDGTITPHLITNGLFVIDKTNEIKFLAEFPTEKWIQVRVSVKGDNVNIHMLGVFATYKIPSTRLVIPNDKVKPVMSLEDTLKFTKESEAVETGVTPKLAFDLDYEKGTVGFRESGEETALFRKIKVELIQPIYK